MRVEVSPEAEEFVRGRGGQLWVWAAHPRVCCWGTPAYMHAATEPPQDPDRFNPAHTAGLQVWYRIPGGRRPITGSGTLVLGRPVRRNRWAVDHGRPLAFALAGQPGRGQ